MNKKITSARDIAFDALMAVETEDAYANLILPALIDRSHLSSRDARLATELAYGTLRMQGMYDSVIEHVSQRKLQTIDLPILVILRLGTHQLLNLRVPPHAAVNEMVQLARLRVNQSSTGFVNAVLRKIHSKNKDEWITEITHEISDPVQRLSIRYSHPAWIVRAFSQSLKQDNRVDELELLLASDNDNPLVTYVDLSNGKSEIPEGSSRTTYSPYGFSNRVARTPHELIRNSNGTIRVQDEGSQLAALALSEQHTIHSSEKWLDLCAGPGGKAALLASRAAETDVRLIANEISSTRAKLVKDALSDFSNSTVVEGDGRQVDFPAQSFDRVLLDAPCSGLGALRRRPEARWRKNPSDVAELTHLQEQLLDSAISLTKPDGIIAYITCSPHIAETKMVIDKALRNHQNLRELDTGEVISSFTKTPLPYNSKHNYVQLWPHVHGTDAMFISLLRLDQ